MIALEPKSHSATDLQACVDEVESITLILLIRAVKSMRNPSFIHMAGHLLITESALINSINGQLLLDALLDVAECNEIGLLRRMLQHEHLWEYHEAISETLELIYYNYAPA